MPELPDIAVYIEAIESRALGHSLEAVRIANPFLLRTYDPPLTEAHGRKLIALRRIGKRIALGLSDDLWLVLHLMIAGRLHWGTKRVALSKRNIAAFDFDNGCLSLTEAGTQRRTALHVVRGEAGLASLDPGGIDVLTAPPAAFAASLTRSNHTLKRALTDPHIFSGIGNSYSDEILHRAKLSPVTLTQRLEPDAIATLHRASIEVLTEWTVRLRADANGKFPEKVTAFRDGMAVHGRYGEPCPRCGTKVQRIRYASNETNYCPECQTGGKLLADRALSRLLREDWPRSLDEMETFVATRRAESDTTRA
jgi:formamidopyrimidine-DNA glycosylase